MSYVKKVLMCTVFAEAFYKSRYEFIKEFIKLGYEIILIAPEAENSIDRKLNWNKIKYYQIDLTRTGVNIFKECRFIKQLQRIIRQEKPDITYAFGGAKAAIYTTIAASKEQINNNFCMINGLGSIYRGIGFKNYIIKCIMKTLFKYSLSKAKGVLFQNKDDLNEFVNSGLVQESKCTIVNGSGVNLAKFPYTPVKTNNVFLFVGRLLKDKGVYEFVNAARIIKEKYPIAEFWILGGYDTNPTAVKKTEIRDWVDSGIVKYFGRRENTLAFYQDCSVFVLPSYHEGTPRTCLEAMAVGRPVITTDAPGCRETVIDGVTGFLIPVKDTLALVKRIEYFLTTELQVIANMGKNARVYVSKKYDVNKVNKSIISFLLGN